MRLDRLDPPRSFEVGKGGRIRIHDCGTLHLAPDEQITLVTEDGAQYDVARKDWGFYATPSMNGRLASHKLRAALVRNAAERYYVFLMEDGREVAFQRYLADEEQTLVAWLDTTASLRDLDPTRRRPTHATIAADEWLAGVLGAPAFRVGLASSGDEGAVDLHQHARLHRGGFYYARVRTDDVAAVAALARVGMTPVDVNVTLTWSAAAPRGPPLPDLQDRVHAVRPEEAAEVVAIAGRAFEHSRFHLDPQFPPALAHKVKREWVANCVRGARGDRVFVATDENGAPVGFLAALATGAGEGAAAVIDLIAVDAPARGSGHGRALVQAFVEHYAPTHRHLRVGTQAANHASLALYQRAGFVVTSTHYVLHMHSPGPEADG